MNWFAASSFVKQHFAGALRDRAEQRDFRQQPAEVEIAACRRAALGCFDKLQVVTLGARQSLSGWCKPVLLRARDDRRASAEPAKQDSFAAIEKNTVSGVVLRGGPT